MTDDHVQPDPGAGSVPAAPAGIIAEFAGADGLKAAAVAARDKGLRRWDVHSPFAIHGMERAMGLRRSPLPRLVLLAGLAGAAAALLLQWWTNAVDFPLVISGKPLFSLPANIPIAFELVVLFAAAAAFLGALALDRLPQYAHPVFSGSQFRRATADGFFLSIDAADPQFDEAAMRRWLESLGAVRVETIDQSPAGRAIPRTLWWGVAVLVVLALLPPLLVAWYRAAPKRTPRLDPIRDMDVQPKYLPQAYSPLFLDHRTMRPPAPETVADGRLEEDSHLYLGKVGGAWATTFPVQPTREMMDRGQERFNVFCAPCHGLVGEGGATGIVSVRALRREEPKWVLPLSLHSQSVRKQPLGQVFNTITHGIRTMPAYGPQIPVADRWAILLYVQALERSRHAGVADVPEDIRPQLR